MIKSAKVLPDLDLAVERRDSLPLLIGLLFVVTTFSEGIMSDLTQQELHELVIYNPYSGLFCWKKKLCKSTALFAPLTAINTTGYRSIRIYGRLYQQHRLAFLYMLGRMPASCVDHINMDGSDNRWVNIRECTKAQNGMNTRIRGNNKSGYKGVTFYKPTSKWMACIKAEGKTIYLGYHLTPEEASKAYEKAAIKYFGEFARMQ